MTTTKSASKKTTRRIARKLNSAFTRKASRAISRRKQLEMKAALERHSRKCIICHHPEREAIEEEFLHWRAPWKLAEDYHLADYRTIYRHARAAGLLLQRRENLHSGLDAFVEAVDDVKFTGDTILRAMRAYSCIDRHGRWTEIPTRVSISTFRDPGPAPSPSPHPENDSDVIDIEPEQLEEDLEEDEEEYDDPEDDPDDDSSVDEDDDDSELDERSLSDHTACADPPAQAMPRNAVRGQNPKGRSEPDHTTRAGLPRTSRGSPARSGAKQYSNPASRSESTACAASPAQAVPKLPSDSSHRGRTVTATACAAIDSNDASRRDATACLASPTQAPAHAAPQSGAMHYSNPASRSESTACAAPPAQPTPRNAVRGHNPQSRSVSDHTACAAIDSNDASHRDATARVASPTQAVPKLPSDSSHRGRTVTATACAALPRTSRGSSYVRSESTACAGLPRTSRGSPAQAFGCGRSLRRAYGQTKSNRAA
jgi:hypothetical protein